MIGPSEDTPHNKKGMSVGVLQPRGDGKRWVALTRFPRGWDAIWARSCAASLDKFSLLLSYIDPTHAKELTNNSYITSKTPSVFSKTCSS